LIQCTFCIFQEPNPVEVDNYVIAKHKNGKYYHARVARMKKETFFKANFKDNSWSDNLYAQDIVVNFEYDSSVGA